MRLLEDNQELAKKYIKDLKIKNTIINLKNINFSYGNRKIFTGGCKPSGNSLTGICGRSGAGKTTLIDIITKPIKDLEIAYKAGQFHFGENKIQLVLVNRLCSARCFYVGVNPLRKNLIPKSMNEINLKLIDSLLIRC